MNKEILKKLRILLRKHKAFNSYYYNFYHADSMQLNDKIQNIMECTCSVSQMIDRSFFWDSTAQGDDFWSKLYYEAQND